MRYLVALLIAFSMGCGRYSWQDNTKFALDGIHETGKTTGFIVANLCEPQLQRCIEQKLNPCPDLERCQKARDQVFRVLESMQRTVKAGLEMMEWRDQDAANKKLMEAFEILAELKVVLQMWGVKI